MINNEHDGSNPPVVPELIYVQDFFVEDHVKKEMKKKERRENLAANQLRVRFAKTNTNTTTSATTTTTIEYPVAGRGASFLPNEDNNSDDNDEDINPSTLWYTPEEYDMIEERNHRIINRMSRKGSSSGSTGSDEKATNGRANNKDDDYDADGDTSSFSNSDDEGYDENRDDSNESSGSGKNNYSTKKENDEDNDLEFKYKCNVSMSILSISSPWEPIDDDCTLGLCSHDEMKRRQDVVKQSISIVLEEQEFQYDFEQRDDDNGNDGKSNNHNNNGQTKKSKTVVVDRIDREIIKDLYVDATKSCQHEALKRAIQFTEDIENVRISSYMGLFDSIIQTIKFNFHQDQEQKRRNSDVIKTAMTTTKKKKEEKKDVIPIHVKPITKHKARYNNLAALHKEKRKHKGQETHKLLQTACIT